MNNYRIPSLWSGQFIHLSALIVLLIITRWIWVKIGSPHPILFWLTISVPIAHQIFVWITWRLELKTKAISNSIGFKNYLVLFFVLFIGRLAVFLFLAEADQSSLDVTFATRLIITAALGIPALYTLYSVKKYFGFARAAGGDHFDAKYRNMAMVKKGMFKYSNNSMYVFGFLIFWGLAVAFNSEAALLAAAFAHAYIWVHYFSTEKPDMNYLYKK